MPDEKIIIICVSVLLVAACAVGAALYVTHGSQNDGAQTGDTTDTAKTEFPYVYLEDFWNGYKKANDTSNISLETIYDESKKLVESGKKIYFKDNTYTASYMSRRILQQESNDYIAV